MALYEFVAIGPGVRQRWRRVLPPGQVIRLGRSPQNGWPVSWDMRVSREHADMVLEGDRLRVRRLPTARNAIYLRGEALNDFTIGPGEDFRIGRTVFHVELAAAAGEEFAGEPDQHDPKIEQLAQQPVERRLESLLVQIDAAEDRPMPMAPPEQMAGEAPGGLPSQEPGNAPSEIDALRAEVKALRAMLEVKRTQQAGNDPQAGPGPAGPVRPTVEGHILGPLEPPVGEQANGDADAENGPIEAVCQAEEQQPCGAEGDAAGGTDLESDLGLVFEDALPAAAVPAQVVDGAALGNYELLDQIHRGGTGQVLKARHRHIDRLVAIKILSGAAAQSEEMVARFRLKAKFLASASHANLVAVYDAGELDGTDYLIMEYVDGDDLVNVLRRETLDVRRAVEYTRQAAQALQYTHARNIVHRNLNPSHLLVDGKGVVKLTGWGLALRIGDQALRAFERPGSLVGTLDYMAPEQIADSWRVDQRADIYGLGCTLFAILTKRVVYPIDWQRRKATAQRFQPPPSLKEQREDIPDSLEAVYLKMMAKVPENRFQAMAELIEALDVVEAEL